MRRRGKYCPYRESNSESSGIKFTGQSLNWQGRPGYSKKTAPELIWMMWRRKYPPLSGIELRFIGHPTYSLVTILIAISDPPGRLPQGWPQSCRENEKSWPLPEIEFWFSEHPAYTPVTTLTELSRFLPEDKILNIHRRYSLKPHTFLLLHYFGLKMPTRHSISVLTYINLNLPHSFHIVASVT
jgi:hypothetical protein